MRLLGKVVTLVVLLAALLPLPLLASDDPGEELESHGLVSDPGPNARIQRVGAGVLLGVRKVNPGFGTRPRFRIVNYFSEQGDLNAAALADGRVYATEGLMATVTSDDELAAVLGHELTHIAEHHHKRQERAAIISGLAGLAARALGANDSIQVGVAAVGGLFSASYSKDDEYRADRGMVDALYASGYDPMAGSRLLQTLQGRYGNGPAKVPVIGWFASHPDTGKRIEGVERRAHELQLNGNIGSYESVNPQTAPAKIRIAVNVHDQYQGGSAFWGNEPSEDRVRSEIQDALLRQQCTWIEVLDRESREEAWQEQDQGDTGRMDPSTVPAKGKTHGASHFLYIDLNYYDVTQQGEVGIGSWSGGARARLVKAELKGKARLTPVETSVNVFSIPMYGSEKGQDIEAESNGRGIDARGNWSSRPAGKALASACDQVAREIIARLGGRRPTVQTPAPKVSPPARPVDVEAPHEFSLNIRPKGARADDSRRVVARFEATLTEVMTLNRVHFFRGNMDVAVAEIDYRKSNPESFALEGTLWSPGWEKLDLSGVSSVRLTSRD